MEQKILVKKVDDPAELEKVFAIRRTVFVDEQHCPPELEWEFEDESTHFLGTVDGIPAGAARWRKTEKGYKLERFAVLKEFRGFGLAAELIRTILADLPEDANFVYLNAQVTAMGLYAKFGFEKVGDQFDEAGIMHYQMIRRPDHPNTLPE